MVEDQHWQCWQTLPAGMVRLQVWKFSRDSPPPLC